jgi:homoserine O-acetyltransferase
MLFTTRAVGRILLCALGALLVATAQAADFPAPKQGDWVARDFKFHTGEVVAELKLHYTTVGAATGEPVLVLHGTTGSGAGMLTPAFAGELFGPGQPLDATKYFIILPDAIGHGQSAKPSDGQRAKFPRYNYDDMCRRNIVAHEGLGIKHLRLIIGNRWAACTAGSGASRTRLHGCAGADGIAAHRDAESQSMLRCRMPTRSATTRMEGRQLHGAANRRRRRASSMASPPTAEPGLPGGATRERADKLLNDRWQRRSRRCKRFCTSGTRARLQPPRQAWKASRPRCWRSTPPMMNQPARDRHHGARRLSGAESHTLLLIPASENTAGHGTTAQARFYVEPLRKLLETAPKRAM